MKNLTRLALAVALTGASVLSAQTTDTPRGPRRGGPGGPGGHGGPGRDGHPIVRTLDADKDSAISAAELAGASAALLSLDANKDGAVTADELRPARPADAPTRPTPPAGGSKRGGGDRAHPVMPVMLALDANSDGALSASEIGRAATSLAALDANRDGKLTRDELRPLPPTE